MYLLSNSCSRFYSSPQGNRAATKPGIPLRPPNCKPSYRGDLEDIRMNAIDVPVLVAGIPPSTCPLSMANLILIDLIQIKSFFFVLIYLV